MSAEESYKKLEETVNKPISYFYMEYEDFYIFDEPIDNIDSSSNIQLWAVYKEDGKIIEIGQEKLKEFRKKYGKPSRGEIHH